MPPVDLIEPSTDIFAEVPQYSVAKDRVYSVLRRRILFDDLHPKEKLSETSLADQFGVSRTPIREAIARLVDDELVVAIPQSGTYVAPISLARADEATQLREMIEPSFTRLAAEQATPEHHQQLRSLIESHRESFTGENYVESFTRDVEFHRFAYIICGNQRIWRSLNRLSSDSYRVRFLKLKTHYRWEQTYAEHTQIVTTFQERRLDELEAITRQHINKCFQDHQILQDAYPGYFSAL